MACLVRAKLNKNSKNEKGLFYIRLWLPHLKKVKTISTGTDNEETASAILEEIEFAEKMRKCKEQAFVTLYDDFMEEKESDALFFERRTISVSSAIKKFIEYKKNKIEESTMKLYKYALAVFGHIVGEKTKLANLNEGHLIDYVNLWVVLQRSDTTIEIRKRSLKVFLNWAIKNKYMKEIRDAKTLD